MTEKELREIKRRFSPEKCNISRIVGCFVNSNKQIIARITQPIGMAESTVNEMLLAVMKRALSGSMGINLTDVLFSTQQVLESEEHKLLMTLRDSELKDGEALEKFYSRVAESVPIEGNFVILLANDIYDVFSRRSDGEMGDSTQRFSYLVCAVCPVKDAPEALTFRESDSLFHSMGGAATLSSPEIGFMFPAFDGRATNIYGALYYTKSTANKYPEFTERVFGCEAPMPPKAQMEVFSDMLSDALSEECSLSVVSRVQDRIGEMIEQHKESKDPEPLLLTKSSVKTLLSECGVEDEKLEAIGEAMDEGFGVNAALSPKTVISTKKFELTMPEVSVKVTPEYKDNVTTRIIDGQKYLMIKVTGEVQVNGITLSLDTEPDGEE